LEKIFAPTLIEKVKTRTLHKNREGCGTQNLSTDNPDGHPPFNSGSVTIESFDLTNFTRLGSITIPNVTGTPLRLIRWGKNGLAFNTGGVGISGQVYLIQSNL